MRTPIPPHRRSRHPATVVAPALAMRRADGIRRPGPRQGGLRRPARRPDRARHAGRHDAVLVGMAVTCPTRRAPTRSRARRCTSADRARRRRSSPWRARRRRGPGHYTMRIEVPASGVQSVEIGMRGTSNLPIMVLGTATSSRGRSARGPRRSPRPRPGRQRARGARASAAGAARGPAGRRPPCDPVTAVTPAAAPVEPGPGPLVLGAARPGGRGLATLAVVAPRAGPVTRGCPAGRPEA